MKPSFASAATAIEPAVQPYDRYYPTPSSLRDMSPQRSSSGGSSSRQHPRHHSSSSAASSSSSSHPQQHHQNHQHHHHHSQYSSPAYHEQQHHQHASRHHSDAQQYPHESHSHSHHSQPPQHRQHDATYASHAPTAHHAYQQYAHSYHSSAQHVKHTEGYEGRVRNTTRDHNDHLMTDPSVKDQQHHHDQFRRDPTYGYLKQHPVPSSPYAQFDEDRPAYKYNLPPILAPEEPFYRSDLPGRHMRYFSTVTSEDRENSQGYYSSARHVAPSNTTGNFGHGPPINATLEKFGSARQRQMEQQMEQQREQQMRQDEELRRQQREEEEAHHQQQHRPRLPSLYTALPEQRPGSSPAMAPQQLQSRGRSPVRKPRSIAPAPLSTPGPLSPIHSKPMASPMSPTSYRSKTNSTYSERPSMIKVEPKDSPQMSYYQQHQQHSYQPYSPRAPSHQQQHQEQSEQRYLEQSEQRHQQHRQAESEGKRKWSRDHSPVRIGPRLKVCVDPTEQRQPSQMDETSAQELHLLSQRAAKPTLAVAHAPKIKSVVQHPRMRMQRYQMTTIRCWHGAIAQKSYGIEKRYLCPPPMVQVSAGVNAKQIRAEQPHVTMSILHEKLSNNSSGSGSENLMEQDCTLDDLLKCSFRNLHVTGTGADSSKRFKLGLQVYLNQNSTIPTAIMDSNPIPIISKPSKKTAKAGNASCFILNGMSVSLLNRINAQTVRTKYMAVDKNAVCAKIGSWSSFTIKMVKPPPAPPVKIVSAAGVNGGNMGIFKAANHSTKFVPIRMKGDNSQSAAAPMAMGPPSMGPVRSPGAMGQQPQQPAHASFQHHQQQQQQQQHRPPVQRAPQSQPQQQSQQQPQQEPTYVFSNSEPVLYGSEIILINDMTGITTDRLIIRKVENGKVVRNGSGPVSQMQKIVLQHPDRVHPEDGRPYYLSASSIGSPKIEGKIPLQAAMDRSPLLEYRTSSKKASIMDLTEQAEDEEDEYYDDEGGYHGHPSSRRASRGLENVAVDDFVCWTIAGIAKFDYTYFGPIPASVDTEVDPRKVPKVLNCPQYKAQSNTLVMKVKNVFERLSPAEEEARLRSAYTDDPYERKLTLSEFVYKRCEDVRQPMQDEEGPIQLWLAQHGPVRMRRRVLKEILPEEEGNSEMAEQEEGHEEESDEDEDEDDEAEKQEAAAQEAKKQLEQQRQMEDKLPKIPTKANAAFGRQARQQQQHQQQQKYYGGSHLPSGSAAQAGQKKKRVKLLARPMGLEAELPFGCEVRAAHDDEGNAHAEMDILMVERATGIAYRTGYKVAYSRQHDSSEWVVEVVG